MTQAALFALVILIWAVVHLARHSPFVRRRLRLLRASRHRGRPHAREQVGLDLSEDDGDADDKPTWTIKTTVVGLNVSTTTLNELPNRWVDRLSVKQATVLARAYDFGIVWGALAMLATVVILAWEGAGLVVWLIRVTSIPAASSRIVKRVVEETTTNAGGGFAEGIIQPLVGPSYLFFIDR
jgi:hypothetical protein